ncbi:MAG: xly, partial [Verrucomicrobiales bacterium]|nr:xly [Verrucomicrobiales bacterium]
MKADLVIFGATSGGIAAAVQAKRLGRSVLIVEWTQHLGGLTTGGLGATDIGNKGAIGGIARQFYEEIADYYARPEVWKWEEPKKSAALLSGQEGGGDPLVAVTGRPTKWTFEPHAATVIYRKWLKEFDIPVYFGERLTNVQKKGARIVSFTCKSGRVFQGSVFIDASYEGDLMARAGVSYHVGRESNAAYGETLNGIRAETPAHQFKLNIDPYRTPGHPESGLLPYIQSGDGSKPGDGDKRVQTYNFRLCMTHTKANQVPWRAPAHYDEAKFELLARLLEAHENAGNPLNVGALMNPIMMPN